MLSYGKKINILLLGLSNLDHQKEVSEKREYHSITMVNGETRKN